GLKVFSGVCKKELLLDREEVVAFRRGRLTPCDLSKLQVGVYFISKTLGLFRWLVFAVKVKGAV
ncbi:MAG TPA: hypothetical protein H9853_11125, partial [Candidatus Sphingobacterium stercoripullorum]|nr:hypothetical protein [Candidatus Sphingobacterium stercoripullorum]